MAAAATARFFYSTTRYFFILPDITFPPRVFQFLARSLRIADPSVPHRELFREFSVVGEVRPGHEDFRPPQFHSPPVDWASLLGEALPLLGEDRSPGSDFLSLNTVSSGPVGGRLALFAHQWEIVTNDPFILSIVSHGFKISLSPGFPGVLRQVTNIPGDPVARATILTEIS